MNYSLERNVLIVIPARGGSEGIKNKNLTCISDKPLIQWSIDAAAASKYVSRIVVSTDCKSIASYVEDRNIQVIDRPASLATSASISEEAILHALETLQEEMYTSEIIGFMQCTTPLTTTADIDSGIEKFFDSNADSLFTAFEDHSYIWKIKGDTMVPVNHDATIRYPRQSQEPHYQENGALYLFKRKGFVAAKNRFFGKISCSTMPKNRSLEIDSPVDLKIVRSIVSSEEKIPATVSVRNRHVGDKLPCYIIAEIGINHNGNVASALKLIDIARQAGCNAVKFQKRTPELCVPEHIKKTRKSTPWGEMSYIKYRHKVELGLDEYRQIDAHCRKVGITWFASCWDTDSVSFLEQFSPPLYKIPSACITDHSLLAKISKKDSPTILSTGMSTWDQITKAVEFFDQENLLIAHCTSSYPCPIEDLNLNMIQTFKREFSCPIGYSGHEEGIIPSLTSVAMGACFVERHITFDKSAWGSDHKSSLLPSELSTLVHHIREFELSAGDGIKKITPDEHRSARRLRCYE